MEAEKCAICLDSQEWGTEIDEKLLTTTSCCHTFHINCLTQWMKQKNTCPLCKHRNPHIEILDLSQGLDVWDNENHLNGYLITIERRTKLNKIPKIDRIKLTVNTKTGELEWQFNDLKDETT